MAKEKPKLLTTTTEILSTGDRIFFFVFWPTIMILVLTVGMISFVVRTNQEMMAKETRFREAVKSDYQFYTDGIEVGVTNNNLREILRDYDILYGDGNKTAVLLPKGE